MYGGGLGCRPDTARSRQSDCHRRNPRYIALASSHFFADASFRSCPFAGRVPLFFRSTGGVKSLNWNKGLRLGVLLLIDAPPVRGVRF